MLKKTLALLATVALIVALPAAPARATASSHVGQVVKMSGYTTLYYVATDGKRYVFPNDKNYKSWFNDYTDVVTLSADEIANIPLAGNVVYRPGVLLLKIDTDPKVYAVARGGILRWVSTETIARSLYGENWNQLIDDVPDSFFTNYTIGTAINYLSDFNPDQEVGQTDTIEANRGISTANAKRARTYKCQITGIGATRVRDCVTVSSSSNNYSDTTKPYIMSVAVSDGGDEDYVDINDSVAITFSEAIDPSSINASLAAGSYVSGVSYSSTGGASVSSSGIFTVKNIVSFDVGSVEEARNFTVKLALNSAGTVLTVTLTSGEEVEIDMENFSSATQAGGTVKDASGNALESNVALTKPSGTFGGDDNNDDDSDGPYITAIKVTDGGDEDYVDRDDTIAITFNEAIDPESINDDLEKGDDVTGVAYSATGGVSISSTGKVTIKNIATFDLGSVDESGNYTVKLALSSTGKVLTITLTSGSDIEITDEDFGSATQIGGTVEDEDGNEMAIDSDINDPTGTFGGEADDDDDEDEDDGPQITKVEVKDGGGEGYVDSDDQIVVTFNEAIDPESVNDDLEKGDDVSGVSYSSTGGVSVAINGKVTVKNILYFDLGSVEESGNYSVKLALNSTGKILTITLVSGNDVEIDDENFGALSQVGGTVKNEDGDTMVSEDGLDEPTGTFGGEYEEPDDGDDDEPPAIESIEIENGGDDDYVDEGDSITITFSEGIDPETVNSHLYKGDEVEGVDQYSTAGVTISSSGLVTVKNIFTFDLGSVEEEGAFEVDLALNSAGDELIITLADGEAVEITNESFGKVTQLGGTIMDQSGNDMDAKSNLTKPSGSFSD